MENQKKSSTAQIRAVNKYNKKTYSNISIRIKPDDAEFIDSYAKRINISKAQLIVKAIRYVADNNITLKDTDDNT